MLSITKMHFVRKNTLEKIQGVRYPRSMSSLTLHDGTPSRLQREIAVQVIDLARENGLRIGAPLKESVLAQEFSVSRTPVRAALRYLTEIGAVKHIPQRGYFLDQEVTALPEIEVDAAETTVRSVYNQIVDAYFSGELSDRMSVAELMRRFDIDRQPLQEALSRLSAEGFMRPNPGYGWVFVPLKKSREADTEDMHRFRLVLEPALLLEPAFEADSGQIAMMRAKQVALIEKLGTDFDVAEVFEANEELHVNLTSYCGSRYFINALDFPTPSGRLDEYRHYQDRERIRQACEEHIAILDAVSAGEMQRASNLMREHILSAQPKND